MAGGGVALIGITLVPLRLRWGFLGQGCNLPGKGGRELLIL